MGIHGLCTLYEDARTWPERSGTQGGGWIRILGMNGIETALLQHNSFHIALYTPIIKIPEIATVKTL